MAKRTLVVMLFAALVLTSACSEAPPTGPSPVPPVVPNVFVPPPPPPGWTAVVPTFDSNWNRNPNATPPVDLKMQDADGNWTVDIGFTAEVEDLLPKAQSQINGHGGPFLAGPDPCEYNTGAPRCFNVKVKFCKTAGKYIDSILVYLSETPKSLSPRQSMGYISDAGTGMDGDGAACSTLDMSRATLRNGSVLFPSGKWLYLVFETTEIFFEPGTGKTTMGSPIWGAVYVGYSNISNP